MLPRNTIYTIIYSNARAATKWKSSNGLFEKILRLAPFVTPVTLQSTVTGEEVIDAMDLRAFGSAPRTWLRDLQYAARDYLVIGFGIAIFLACCILKWGFGIGDFFVPDFFTQWVLR